MAGEDDCVERLRLIKRGGGGLFGSSSGGRIDRQDGSALGKATIAGKSMFRGNKSKGLERGYRLSWHIGSVEISCADLDVRKC